MSNKPLWRWWLFCAALSLWWRFEWDWARRLYGWCVLPEWLGWDGTAPAADDEVPW